MFDQIETGTSGATGRRAALAPQVQEGRGRYAGSIAKARPRDDAWRAFVESHDTRLQSYRPHEVVFYEDDPADHLYEIAEGSVMLYCLLGDGRRQVVDILGAGDLIGISGTGYFDCSAEALSEVRLRMLDRQSIERDPALQVHVNRCLMSRIEGRHSHAVLLGRKSASERVASFLMRFVPGRGEMGCRGPQTGDDSRTVVLRMSRQEIADYLGLTIETVSRTLSDMKRRGIISIEKNDHIRLASVCRVCKLTGIH